MTMEIATAAKPIETHYKGHRFRSRLEARWAVFFDHLGIRWTYEPQGYETSAGPYLPDFWVGNLGWIEVKGRLTVTDHARIRAGAALDGLPSGLGYSRLDPAKVPTWMAWNAEVNHLARILVLGDIPEPRLTYGWAHWRLYVTLDGKVISRWVHLWPGTDKAVKPVCLGGFWQDDAETRIPHGSQWPALVPHPKLDAAYQAARSARFEHGERG